MSLCLHVTRDSLRAWRVNRCSSADKGLRRVHASSKDVCMLRSMVPVFKYSTKMSTRTVSTF
jgi:hypothetical protein